MGAGRWVCRSGALIAAVVALFVGLDPLQLSPIAGIPDFKALPMELPPAGDRIHNIVDEHQKLKDAEVWSQNEVIGPESLAFDSAGRGPYTGIADGRVVRWDGPEIGWTEFALTSPNRTSECAPKQPPALNLAAEHICGRPLGLRFHPQTGELVIADAYNGLLSVGPEGGLATPLVTEAEGVPFALTNDVDFGDDGKFYFTVSSSKYQRRQFSVSILSGDNTGRLLSYDPATKETKVLLQGLQFANGLAVSRDASFLIMAESSTARLWKYWLKGPKAATAEVFANLPGFPDNVRRNKEGHFWVAIHARLRKLVLFLADYPQLRAFILKLPIPIKYFYLTMMGRPHAMIMKFDEDGNVLEVLEDSIGATTKLVSEVEEKDGQLWIGSVLLPRILVYPIAQEK